MKVIFIEGSDYSGKTTIINELEFKLKSLGYTVLKHREPSGFYRDILLKDETIKGFIRRKLFQVNHIEVLDNIYRNRDNFDIAIIDRCSVVSDFVYSEVSEENEVAHFGIILDDCKTIDTEVFDSFFSDNSTLFFLDIDKEEFLKRVESRENISNDVMDLKDVDFKLKIFNSYKALMKVLSKNRFRRLNRLFFNTKIISNPSSDKIIKEVFKDV